VCSPLEAERWTYERCDPDGLLFVGRFDRAKGADILLEAFGRVLRVRPSARLIIVGADTGIADEYGRRVHAPEYIARLLPARWMAERIEVLGIRTPQEIIELRRRSCISVVASRYESFSMVTLEAMAAGAPVIAPNVGGISEIIEHEHNGLLFRPEDAANLAATILQLMSNPAMARTLGQQAARNAVMNYSPAGIARHTLTFHQEVIERSRYKAQMR
jgi:glycosyltransferase involved in cell wall biosynthesis